MINEMKNKSMNDKSKRRKQENTGAYQRKILRDNIDLLQQKRIPEAWPTLITEKPLAVKEEIIGHCGYCLLAYDWLRPLAEWIGTRPCLEIMCGSGSLSKGLQDCGAVVRATDDHSWMKDHAISWFVDSWTAIEQQNAVAAIEKYGEDVDFIICSWPFRSEDCYQALLKLREVNAAARMIYIGEWRSGANASNSFFDAAECVADESFNRAVQQFKSIYGNSDYPYLIK